MANALDAFIALSPDRLQRSVSVVVDPLDIVTGRRARGPLSIRIRGVEAAAVPALSGAHCFVDLALPSGGYVVVVDPLLGNAARYFGTEVPLSLVKVPVPGQPLLRNPVDVQLLPRPGYPFDSQTTLARGRLMRTSHATPAAGARIALVLEGVDKGIRGRTDERGEFAMAFPRAAPEDNASAGLKTLKFRLRFEVAGKPPLVTGEAQVEEGSTTSLGEIKFPWL